KALQEDVGKVMAEVRMLQDLVETLTTAADPSSPPDEVTSVARLAEASDQFDPLAGPGTESDVPVLDDAAIVHLVRDGIAKDRVDLVLQPVVSLPQRKRRFYECFSRIVLPGGAVLTPEQYIPVAERAGLVAAIDNLMLVRCVQLVRRARRDHIDVGFFCNISNASLTDVDFFQDFIAFMAENRQLAETLIFEFDYASIAAEDYITRMNLQRLRGCGYRFSLDQVGELDLDLDDLSSQGFRYVKVNAHLLHEMARGDDPILDMRSFKGALDRHAMDLIVEKIESEEMLLDLLELKVDFGQGYLFGEPRPLVDKQ
ncbi:MAG: EAL domain-containing protein, partial [bacterium]|nr:EAL domain-containing protein [bacterium]